MPKQLDVYRDWLRIEETARPLNNYQLLRLKKFEDDTSKIREHYRKLNSHVRKYAVGEFANESQQLLNELSKAMLCLTDDRRKGEYDATLGRADRGDKKQRTFEELLLLRKVVEPDQLAKARNYAKAVGVEVRDALVQQKLAKADVVVPAYAESIGLPFLDLADIDIDPDLATRIPAAMARQHSCVPIMIDGDKLLMASPNPLDPHVEEELRLRFGTTVRSVLCTPANISDAVTRFYGKDTSVPKAAPTLPGAPVAAAPATQAAAKPAGPVLSREEKKKRRLLITAMAFNFSFMGFQFFKMFQNSGTFMSNFGMALLVGAVVAGLTFVGMMVTDS